jgi:hypothetical protein
MSKMFFAAGLLLALAACAQAGSSTDSGTGAGSGSVSMYGVLDQGVSVTHH